MSEPRADSLRPVLAHTLTFLFSDLRDYTRFVETRGDAAASALIAEYRRIVRAEVARSSGAEIKTEGDSFYVVFPTAGQAVACAIGIQRAAEQQARAMPERPVRVGIGIHAGEPVPQEGQYVGAAVNVAARACGAAAAGEILVSEVVRGLLRTAGELEMEDRGVVALKGIADPPRLFRVMWAPLSPQPKAPASKEISLGAETPQDRRILCPVVVGRDPELQALAELLEQARGGSTRVALLSGEAGLGKTTLLREFALRATAAGARVLRGECIEAEARRPFGPLVEILQTARRVLPSAEEWLRQSELAVLLPAGARPGAAAASLGESERYRIHDAVVRLLSELGGGAPLVVQIEDLHWADEATLELFAYLVRKLHGAPVLLLGTYRSDELHRQHPLRPVLAELARTRQVRELTLRPLALAEVGEVIQAALGLEQAPTAEFRELMHDRCEGNPFFIEEVLRALVERGDLEHRNGAWQRTKQVADLAIPDTVRDAVHERIATLDDDARRALQYAAVIGQRFGFELLQRVAELPERTLVSALRAAVDAQLVTADRDVRGEEVYAFRHALTRESVAADLLQRERRLMHLAVAEALESGDGDPAERAEQLAYHFDEARDPRALDHRVAAAREARRVYAYPRAVRHLERALELSPEAASALGDLELELADAAQLAGDEDRALRAVESARRRFAAGDVRRLAATLERLARLLWGRGQTARALAVLEEARHALEPLGPTAELAAVLARQARLAAIDGRWEEAAASAEQAAAIAREAGAVQPLASALATLAGVQSGVGRMDLAAPMLREAFALADASDLVLEAQGTLNNLWFVYLRGGWFDEAEEVHLEMLGYADAHAFLSPLELQRRFAYALRDGDWQAALALAERIPEEAIVSGYPRITRAEMIVARDGPEQGLPLLAAPRAQLLAAGDRQWRGMLGYVAQTYLLAGDVRRALEELEPIIDLIAQDFLHHGVTHAAVLGVAAAQQLGDEAELRRWIGIAAGGSLDVPALRLQRALATAEAAALEGDVDRAIGLLEGIPGAWRYPGLPLVPTLADLRRAELLAGRGDAAAAAQAFARATAYWRTVKAEWYLARLAEWARERGIRDEPRGSTTG